MTENNNNQNLYANDKIHVNSYNRDDGTHVKDYYRSRPNQATHFLYSNDIENNKFEQSNYNSTKSNISPEEVIEIATIVVFVGIEVYQVYRSIKSIIDDIKGEAKKKNYVSLNAGVSKIQNNIAIQAKNLIEYKGKLKNLNENDYSKAFEQYKKMENTYNNTLSVVNDLSEAVEQKDDNRIEENLSKLNNYINLNEMENDLFNNQISDFIKPKYDDSINRQENFTEKNELERQNNMSDRFTDKKINPNSSFNGQDNLNANDVLSKTYIPVTEKELLSSAEFVKKLCLVANCINKKQPYELPDDVEIIDKNMEKSSNFKAVVFKYKNRIIICFAGTDTSLENLSFFKDWAANTKMALNFAPKQMNHAKEFFKYIFKKYNDETVTFEVAGHSEGGSEAIYVGLSNDVKIYSYNAFALGGHILKTIKNAKQRELNYDLVTNFRDPHDPVSKLLYKHVGTSYIVLNPDVNYQKELKIGNIKAHALARMGDCNNAIPIEKYKNKHAEFINSISDIQFTRDIINDLTTSELYELYEPEIFRRLKTGDILTNSQAQELVQQGELTYLQENDIIKSAIKGYFLKP